VAEAGGILRVHFTAADRGRVLVARTVDPLWEMVFSRHRLSEPVKDSVGRTWARWVRRDVGIETIRPGLRVLTSLAPLGRYFPDFLTPAEGALGLLPGVEAIRATPPARLRHELGQLVGVRQPPNWMRSLADGDQELLSDLGNSLIAYHRCAIEPHTDTIEAAVEADRARRARVALDGGVDQLLDSMRPIMRWQPPVLEVRYAVNRDLYLRGRGLRLVPSYFCRGEAVALADPELPPTLVYPIHHEPVPPPPGSGAALAALLGTTRHAVLAAIGSGATTTELARRVRIAPSTVSRHTTVLRNAGIIETQRLGPSVLHTVTPVGVALLNAG
jgi:DNA-binding transcriptional ArsR family regulator